MALYNLLPRAGRGATPSQRGWNLKSYQAQFSSIQELPLNGVTRFQTDSSGQCEGETHIQPGLLTLGANGLNF